MRINKLLAGSGISSRRGAEALIAQGLVKVNGAVVTNLATQVDFNDQVEVSGKIIHTNSTPRLWIYHKPVGLLTTNSDPFNRPTIFDNLKGLPRVISIGRLDLNSEGLLLLTNNGDLSRTFELPANKIQRIYKVRAYGNINKLLPHFNKSSTLDINCINYKIGNITLLPSSRSGSTTKNLNHWLEISLYEGKNREIRKILEHFDLQVNRLIRVSYGPFNLDGLKPGKYLEQEYNVFKKFLRQQDDQNNQRKI